MRKATAKSFAICIDNEVYESSLITHKVYRLLPDAEAATDDMVRLVDESGEDYLYHQRRFAFVDFPPSARRQILQLETVR